LTSPPGRRDQPTKSSTTGKTAQNADHSSAKNSKQEDSSEKNPSQNQQTNPLQSNPLAKSPLEHATETQAPIRDFPGNEETNEAIVNEVIDLVESLKQQLLTKVEEIAATQRAMGKVVEEHHAFLTNLNTLMKGGTGAPQATTEQPPPDQPLAAPAPPGTPTGGLGTGNPMGDLIMSRIFKEVMGGEQQNVGLISDKTILQLNQMFQLVDAIRGGPSLTDRIMMRAFPSILVKAGLLGKEDVDAVRKEIDQPRTLHL
jgi:molybdopterin converting factor small subunit